VNVRAGYHSPLRESQAAATRALIVEACVALMQQGSDLTYAAVAAAAQVQERTVYRHFPKKDDLEAALWEWIVQHHTHADLGARNQEQLIAAMRASFGGFDEAASLIQAMLHSPQGLEVRHRQQAARREMFTACVEDAVPGLPPAIREHAAAVLQVLYSAAAWEQLRTFWDMDAAQAASAVELGIRGFIGGLQQQAAATRQHPAPPRSRRTP
jgi:AcrR family transcriptional regulator